MKRYIKSAQSNIPTSKQPYLISYECIPEFLVYADSEEDAYDWAWFQLQGGHYVDPEEIYVELATSEDIEAFRGEQHII